MSKNPNQKKYRKQSRRRTFPWPLLALGGVLLLAAVFLFASKDAGNTSQTGNGTANIAVDQASIDYGYVKFGENRQFKIKVTNTGDGLLSFKEQPYIEVLDGC